MTMIEYTLPVHWASSLINGDDSGLDDIEQAQLDEFIADMIDEHGKCYCIGAKSDDTTFFKYHDASSYGVLACECAIFVFES